MKNTLQWQRLVGLCGGVALSTSLSAVQTPPAGQSGQPDSSSSAVSAQREVTAVGCLQRAVATGATGSESRQGGTGAGASSADAGGFVLKNAIVSMGTGPAGASGGAPASESTAGGSASSGAPSSQAGASKGAAADQAMKGGREIRLAPAPSVSLEEHVGHQVEVRGRLMESGTTDGGSSSQAGSPASSSGSSATSSSATGQSTSSQDSRRGGSMSGRSGTLQVSSVRMIASSCTTGS